MSETEPPVQSTRPAMRVVFAYEQYTLAEVSLLFKSLGDLLDYMVRLEPTVDEPRGTLIGSPGHMYNIPRPGESYELVHAHYASPLEAVIAAAGVIGPVGIATLGVMRALPNVVARYSRLRLEVARDNEKLRTIRRRREMEGPFYPYRTVDYQAAREALPAPPPSDHTPGETLIFPHWGDEDAARAGLMSLRSAEFLPGGWTPPG